MKKNGGIRKRCGCPRKKWPKCPHAWHFNFKWKETHYRLSLDEEVGKPIESKSDAEGIADRIRTAIRAGTFRQAAEAAADTGLTFREFASRWEDGPGAALVDAKINAYRLKTICSFQLADRQFGDTPLDALTTADIESFRSWRRGQGLSSVAVNHDLKLLRKMLNWGIRNGLIERTPFKIGTEPAISLEREIPRNWRFAAEKDEQKLLDACNPHLRAVVVAMLDTASRPGELLSLQWKDVNLTRKELTIRAEKAKTRTERLIPISTQLHAILEIRKVGPDGEDHPPSAYVFGDETGAQVKSVRTAWENARTRAGMTELQLRDLRHEAGSRFEEAGVPIVYVSKLLGHSNLVTTSRYLNIHRRGLHAAMEKLEAHRPAVAQPLHNPTSNAQAVVQDSTPAESTEIQQLQ